ncbi:hypothetical protein HPB51_000403 [Rhipicephalus microplus]|uniref:Uncharacterized protein n=1 Tax=Rhipicephalus microplus TaxID=6941 RepID=A0A9J6EEG2_RHIMP|nr:hypothetical protein HPB51_000403 [Rhipicephalus microplus]
MYFKIAKPKMQFGSREVPSVETFNTITDVDKAKQALFLLPHMNVAEKSPEYSEWQTVKTGDSVPQHTSGYWEGDFCTRSTQTEVARESSTQTEPLTISSYGVWLNENAALADTHFITSASEDERLTVDTQRLVLHNSSDDTRHSFIWKFASRWNSTPFLIAVAALVSFVFVLVVIGTILGTYSSNPKMDGLEMLPDLFENEPSVSVVHEQVVNITASTMAHADTTAPVVAKKSLRAAHSARSAKVRKATNTAHRESIPTEDARGTTYAVRKLPITTGLRWTSTLSTTMDHRKGVQVVGTHDLAQRKYHLDEVTGKNDVLSRMVYELTAAGATDSLVKSQSSENSSSFGEADIRPRNTDTELENENSTQSESEAYITCGALDRK